MSTPHTCPVCEGKGTLDPFDLGEPKECPACKGTCVVWEGVPVNDAPVVPLWPWYPPHPYWEPPWPGYPLFTYRYTTAGTEPLNVPVIAVHAS